MKEMQKVFAIVKKENNEIISYGLTSKSIYSEWENYYAGENFENDYFLTETFISKNQIKSDISIN